MRFQPGKAVVEGPAFSRPFKAMACILVFGCAIWLWLLYSTEKLVIGPTLENWFFVAAGLGMMFYTLVHLLISRTKLTATAIEQSWIWNKQIEVRELAYARLIRVRGFEWLFAPRFYTRSLSGKLAVFYAANPLLLSEFERLASELEEFRRPK